MNRYASEHMRFSEMLGAACGHCALAAWIDIPLVIVCHECFQMDGTRLSRPWVNMPDMEAAFSKAELSVRIVGRVMPTDGLALIQWEGPWTRPNVPQRVACMHRHWVALKDHMVWDVNLEEWVPLGAWEEFVPELFPNKGTGWSVARGYELTRTKEKQ